MKRLYHPNFHIEPLVNLSQTGLITTFHPPEIPPSKQYINFCPLTIKKMYLLRKMSLLWIIVNYSISILI